MVGPTRMGPSASGARNVLVVVHDRDRADTIARSVAAAATTRCCGVATTLADGLDLLRGTVVHVAVVSLDLPGVLDLQAVEVFRAVDPGLPLVVLASEPGRGLLREVIRMGVAGFATFDAPLPGIVALCEAASATTTLVEGTSAMAVAEWEQTHPPFVTGTGPDLTRREAEVLALLGRGHDTGSIARHLGLSVHTTRGHVKRILGKLDAHTQLEAVVNASELGLIDLRHPPGGAEVSRPRQGSRRGRAPGAGPAGVR